MAAVHEDCSYVFSEDLSDSICVKYFVVSEVEDVVSSNAQVHSSWQVHTFKHDLLLY